MARNYRSMFFITARQNDLPWTSSGRALDTWELPYRDAEKAHRHFTSLGHLISPVTIESENP